MQNSTACAPVGMTNVTFSADQLRRQTFYIWLLEERTVDVRVRISYLDRIEANDISNLSFKTLCKCIDAQVLIQFFFR